MRASVCACMHPCVYSWVRLRIASFICHALTYDHLRAFLDVTQAHALQSLHSTARCSGSNRPQRRLICQMDVLVGVQARVGMGVGVGVGAAGGTARDGARDGARGGGRGRVGAKPEPQLMQRHKYL